MYSYWDSCISIFVAACTSIIISQAQITAFNYWICIWCVFTFWVFFSFLDTKLEKPSTPCPPPLSESIPSKEQCSKNLFPSRGKQNFTRHPSLIKLVKSIESDRRKIQSAPTSPVKISASTYLFLKFVFNSAVTLHETVRLAVPS